MQRVKGGVVTVTPFDDNVVFVFININQMKNEEEEEFERRLQAVPTIINIQFQILRYRKMLKVKMSSKHIIRHYIPLFSSKFDSDFATFHLTAAIKLPNYRKEVRTDIPIRFLLAQLFRKLPAQPIPTREVEAHRNRCENSMIVGHFLCFTWESGSSAPNSAGNLYKDLQDKQKK